MIIILCSILRHAEACSELPMAIKRIDFLYMYRWTSAQFLSWRSAHYITYAFIVHIILHLIVRKLAVFVVE